MRFTVLNLKGASSQNLLCCFCCESTRRLPANSLQFSKTQQITVGEHFEMYCEPRVKQTVLVHYLMDTECTKNYLQQRFFDETTFITCYNLRSMKYDYLYFFLAKLLTSKMRTTLTRHEVSGKGELAPARYFNCVPVLYSHSVKHSKYTLPKKGIKLQVSLVEGSIKMSHSLCSSFNRAWRLGWEG